jgi:hypothetical protein
MPPNLAEFPAPSSTIALFRYSCSQPLSDETKYPSISDAMLDELQEPIVSNFIEKAPDVGVKNPIHFPSHDSHPERIQRHQPGTVIGIVRNPHSTNVGKLEHTEQFPDLSYFRVLASYGMFSKETRKWTPDVLPKC